MNVKNKLRMATVIWFVGGLLLIVSAFQINPWLVGPLIIVLLVIVNIFSHRLKCSNCGTSVLLARFDVFGREIWFWSSKMPDRCRKCGYDLRKG